MSPKAFYTGIVTIGRVNFAIKQTDDAVYVASLGITPNVSYRLLASFLDLAGVGNTPAKAFNDLADQIRERASFMAECEFYLNEFQLPF